MKNYYLLSKFYLRVFLLASLWSVASPAQAGLASIAEMSQSIGVSICETLDLTEKRECIELSRLTSSTSISPALQKEAFGLRHGYYKEEKFHLFDSDDWLDDNKGWNSSVGGFSIDGQGWINRNEQDTQKRLTRRWRSHVNGRVSVTNKLLVSPNSNKDEAIINPEIIVTVLVDGIPQDQFSTFSGDPIFHEFNADVKRGSTIDLILKPNSNAEVRFSLDTDIYLHPGIIFKRGLLNEKYLPRVFVDPKFGFCNNTCLESDFDLLSFTKEVDKLSPLLGSATTPIFEFNESGMRNGWAQYYQNGGVFQSGSNQILSSIGNIGRAYVQPGYEGGHHGVFGLLGFPISNTLSLRDGGKIQLFEYGWLVESSYGEVSYFENRGSEISSWDLLSSYRHPNSLNKRDPIYLNEVGILNQRVIESANYAWAARQNNQLKKQPKLSEIPSVQATNDFATYINQPSELSESIFGNRRIYPYSHEIIPIKHEYIEQMAEKALSAVGSDFLDSRFKGYPCALHKGVYGKFSNEGLVEWSAEGIEGLNYNEGFIDNVIECGTGKPNGDLIDVYEYFGIFDSEEGRDSTSTPPLFSRNRIDDLSNIPAFISPEILEYFIKLNLLEYKPENWLKMIFEGEEFKLTDPSGHTLSYSLGDEDILDSILDPNILALRYPMLEGGELTDIWSSTYSPESNEVDLTSCGSGNGNEQSGSAVEFRKNLSRFYIFIPNRKQGKYSLEISSPENTAQALLGNSDQSTLIAPNANCEVPGSPGPGPGITPNPGDPIVPGDPGNPAPDPEKPTPMPDIDIIIRPPGTPKPEPVPEPSRAVGLLAAALMGGWWRKRRRS